MSISPISRREEASGGEEESGLWDKLKKGDLKGVGGGIVHKICGFADNHPDPTIRKVRRVVIYLGLLLLAGIALSAVTQGFNLSSLASGSMTTIMGLTAVSGVAALLVTLILHEIISKKYHQTVAKVMGIMLPFIMLAAGGCLLGAGLTKYGFISTTAMGNYGLAGMLLIAGAFYGGGLAIESLQHNDLLFKLNKPIPTPPTDEEREAADRLQRTRDEISQLTREDDSVEMRSLGSDSDSS